jgi:hypothetical protein
MNECFKNISSLQAQCPWDISADRKSYHGMQKMKQQLQLGNGTSSPSGGSHFLQGTPASN